MAYPGIAYAYVKHEQCHTIRDRVLCTVNCILYFGILSTVPEYDDVRPAAGASKG